MNISETLFCVAVVICAYFHFSKKELIYARLSAFIIVGFSLRVGWYDWVIFYLGFYTLCLAYQRWKDND